MTHRWGAPPSCIPLMRCRQCCQVRWHLSLVARHSSKDLVFFHFIHVRQGSLACAAVDAPFNDMLVALQASFSFWCSNRGPLVKMISNRLQTWYYCRTLRVASALTMLVSRVPGFEQPRRRAIANVYKLGRLPLEGRKRLLCKKHHSSVFRARAHRALREMLMLG